MGIIVEEIGRYDPYTDKFIKNTTTDRIEIGTDGNLYRLTVSNGDKFLPIDELYTKADMVAMLEDLKQDIIAEAYGIETDCSDYVVNVADIDMVIQQEIKELKRPKGEYTQ